jgi:hypothetical protein
MKRYSITKYNPIYRDEDGCYTLDEWTAISDIGRTFNNGKLEEKEYLKVENAYIQAVNICVAAHQISRMLIAALQKNSETEDEEVLSGDVLFKRTKIPYSNISEGAEIEAKNIGCIVQLCLRETIWCFLYSNETHFLINFGYDYYMDIICDGLSEETKIQIMQLGLFVEEFELP